jgi:hypothetical protein
LTFSLGVPAFVGSVAVIVVVAMLMFLLLVASSKYVE